MREMRFPDSRNTGRRASGQRPGRRFSRARRLFFPALLAFSLTAASAAYAAQKPEDMDDATWMALQDNVLEYQELENRVASFNPTMVQIVNTINDSYDTIDDTIADYHEAANDFEWLYDDALDQGDYESAVMYQINRTITLQLSSSYMKQNRKKEQTIDRSTRQYRKLFTSACQQLMVAYNQMRVNRETLEKQVELYTQMASLSGLQDQMGMITGTDYLSAQANLYSAQTSLASLEDQMESIRRSLLLLTGWEYDSDVIIGEIPDADVSLLDQIDLEADKAAAPGNNYTIINIRNTSPADADGDGHYENKDYRARERRVDEAKQQLSITLDNLYQTLYEKKAALQAQKTAFEGAQLTMDSAERKYQLGMMGQAEYLSAQLAYSAARAACESADLNMSQAMLNYYWAVNGLGQLTE